MAEGNLTKVCRDCGISKPLSDYGKKQRGVFGVRPECNSCRSNARRARYANDEAYRASVLDAQRRSCSTPPEGFVKQCPKCGETKPFDGFYRSSFSKDNCSSYCKVCQNLRSTSYARENKDKIQPHLMGYSLKRRYGISVAEYEAMLIRQEHKCAICGTSECQSGRNLAVDHCHGSMKIRGLLCSACNQGLGNFKDRPDLMSRAIEYLVKARAT
jgi:uncharacterized protein (DUF983 family)